MSRARIKPEPKLLSEMDALLTFWSGRLTEIGCALDRARLGPLPPRAQREVCEAFYALNRAQVYLREASPIRSSPVPRRRAKKRKA